MMDSFVWLHIASFVYEFDDLCALAHTCHEFYDLFTPLREKYQEWHCRRVIQVKKHVLSMVQKTRNNSLIQMNKQDLILQYETFGKAMRKSNRMYSDMCFKKWLSDSPLNALITCVNRRAYLNNYQYSFILLEIHIDPFMWVQWNGVQHLSSFWYNQVDPSLLEFAFKNDRLNEEKGLINYSNQLTHMVNCWLWYKPQKMPNNGTRFVALNHRLGKCAKFVIHERKCYQYDKSDMWSLFCTEEEWDFKFETTYVIVKFKPLLSGQINPQF